MAADSDSDVFITQGVNYPPIQWQFLASESPDVAYPLAGKTVILKITNGRGNVLIERTATDSPSDLALDTNDGMVTWTPEIAETLMLPIGRIAKYRVEWHEGDLHGKLIAGHIVVSEDEPDIE